ncbi:DNA-binding response regulator, partial [Lysobacter sp. 2RAB21]
MEPRLLLARLRAILRRSQAQPQAAGPSMLSYGGLQIDLTARQVRWKGEEVDLKTADYNLFVILAQAAGRVLSRDELLRRWRGI